MKKWNYQIREYDDFKNMDKFKTIAAYKYLSAARIRMKSLCGSNKNGSFAIIQNAEELEIILQKIENTF